jgi:hypothetical protein
MTEFATRCDATDFTNTNVQGIPRNVSHSKFLMDQFGIMST